MSESFAERLSRFTPDSASLNRDAVLFNAGRASVRPNHRWKALAATLAASQMLTLVLLWPHTPMPSVPSPRVVISEPPAVPEPTPSAPDPSSLIVLRERLLEDESDCPAAVSDGPMVSDDPPLRVFDAASSIIVN